jgi:hypothetical protein
MSKILFLILVIAVILSVTLVGCTQQPFHPPSQTQAQITNSPTYANTHFNTGLTYYATSDNVGTF